ncbi:MFS transporter [Streptomyces sp. 8N616]|uniref:MFS transporter n=1 Tax=Streptomyces sp. 8N616 TaxID=3457414 RepID=UPI003FCF85D1
MATTTPAGVRGDTAAAGTHTGHPAPMTHRQIMEALSGLLLGMFVAILSSTIVSNALPEIISDLGGGQSAYTWVVTASLLAMTATTPLWGKLADLTSKKTLVQLALIIYVLASAGAGLAQSPETLITFRVFQGVGVGGLSALAQIVMAAMISPRERGRYSGYLGATFAIATVGGPLLGGVITDTSWLGWRWCFYVGVPFAVIALIVLQKTLKLPVVKREAKVDWTGAFFVTAAVSLLLVWVTLAGDAYEWLSWQSYAMVGGSVALGLIFILVEAKASEPIIPLRLFRNRTITLASLASLFVGVAMFGATVFLSQYFQLARDESPTMSGVMTIPMIAGLFVSSTVSGQAITRTGRWKAWLVSGAVLVAAGLGLLGTMRYDTAYWHIAIFMALLGLGIGMMMQNLVLATQNQVAPQDLGAASSVVTFFRSLGGAVGVSALGAVLAHRITDYVRDGMAGLGSAKGGAAGGGSDGSAGGGTGSAIPDMDKLPAPIRTVVESAYGHGIADIYLYAAPIAVVALVTVLLIKEVPLKTKLASGGERGARAGAGTAAPGRADVTAGADSAAARPEPVAHGAAGVELKSGAVVQGTVRAGSGRRPLAHARVTLTDATGNVVATSTTGEDGAYAFGDLGAGDYTVIASGYPPVATPVVVTGDGPDGCDIELTHPGE